MARSLGEHCEGRSSAADQRICSASRGFLCMAQGRRSRGPGVTVNLYLIDEKIKTPASNCLRVCSVEITDHGPDTLGGFDGTFGARHYVFAGLEVHALHADAFPRAHETVSERIDDHVAPKSPLVEHECLIGHVPGKRPQERVHRVNKKCLLAGMPNMISKALQS